MPRVAVAYRTASKATYKRFREKHPTVKLSYSDWAGIIYGFNHSFRDYLLETGSKVKMPWGFGAFSVTKKKKRRYKTDPDGVERINLSVDWKATREAGKRIYHTNPHTEGYNFYWRWEPATARFYMAHIWYFKASRETSRLLATYLGREGYQHRYQEWGTV